MGHETEYVAVLFEVHHRICFIVWSPGRYVELSRKRSGRNHALLDGTLAELEAHAGLVRAAFAVGRIVHRKIRTEPFLISLAWPGFSTSGDIPGAHPTSIPSGFELRPRPPALGPPRPSPPSMLSSPAAGSGPAPGSMTLIMTW